MLIKTSDQQSVKNYLQQLKLPSANSHKGQNGKLLVIGGSSLFHSASIWAAEIASHFVDIVHYSSTQENNEIMLSLKKKFHNGIVVPQKYLFDYVKEDNVVLVGPGMMREGKEGEYAYNLVKKLITDFPQKQFVFDAGALQVMKKDWLLKLVQPAIITPHQQEFKQLFGQDVSQAKSLAESHRTVILLKAIQDLITDGKEEIAVEGGNAGLTKGGTGDILAGLAAALTCSNPPLISAVSASLLLKLTADGIYQNKGPWYNIDDIIDRLPEVLTSFLLFDKN